MLARRAVRRPWRSERVPIRGEAMAWRRLGLSAVVRGVGLSVYVWCDLREEAPHCAAEEDNVVSRVDGALESGLVPVKVRDDRLQQACRFIVRDGRRGFVVAVVLEELWEEREDKGEGYLDLVSSRSLV